MTGIGGWTTLKFDVIGDADCMQTLNMTYTQPWNFKSWDKVKLNTVNVKVMGKKSSEPVMCIQSMCQQEGWERNPMTCQCEAGEKWATFEVMEKPMNVKVPAGKNLVLTIKGNATTGFNWQMRPLKNKCLVMISNEYEKDPMPEGAPMLMGRGGTRTFTFKKVNPDSCKESIAFASSRGEIPDADWLGMTDMRSVDITLQ